MTSEQRPLIPVNPKGLEEIAAALLTQPTDTRVQAHTTPQEFPEIIKRNPRDYIYVPGENIVIGTRQDYNGLNWEDAIKSTSNKSLRLTPISSFMQHYLNLREAAAGRKQLVYADGSSVTKDQAVNHWNYVSSTDRVPFGNKPFWTWLDAKFVKYPQGLLIHLRHDVSGNAVQSNLRFDVRNYLSKDGWAELSSLDAHGLPKSASAVGNYIQGQNIYFWPPKVDRVAGFGAGSVGAYLNCGGEPSVVIPRLGVLACAAGLTPKK